MACQHCKEDVPTAEMRFFQNVGKMFLHELTRIRGRFCADCGEAWCREFTVVTLKRGWWSPTSVILVPFLLLRNLWGYLKCVRLRIRGR